MFSSDKSHFYVSLSNSQLIFVPFLGQGLWALGFPSMKRYSKETLNKHPELRGKDLETTKSSCENLRGQPVSMLIYAEGTRFTPEKHSKKKSPYKNLLKPSAGGIHTVLSSLGDELTSILNVTLVYPGHTSPSLFDFLLGKIPKVVIRIEALKLGENDVPSFEKIKSKAGSLAVRNFLNQTWEVKDKIISKIHSESSITREHLLSLQASRLQLFQLVSVVQLLYFLNKHQAPALLI